MKSCTAAEHSTFAIIYGGNRLEANAKLLIHAVNEPERRLYTLVDIYWKMCRPKGVFIATQLNSTQLDVELS